jgi:hypothetical protein
MAQMPPIAGEFGEDWDGNHCTTTLDATFKPEWICRKATYRAWLRNAWGN